MIQLVVSLLVAQGYFANSEKPANKTGKLIEKIRRQLMENNYDYLSSEEELLVHPHQDGPNDPLYNDNDTLADSTDRQDRAGELLVPRGIDVEDDNVTNDHAVSKKDLLYYVDDDRLRGAKNNYVDEADDFDDANNSSNTAKYKVLNVKSVDPNRRSLSYGRFIQEQNDEGVAIISLDGQPFPDFHLPRGRRQYMQDRESGDLGDDSWDNSTPGVDGLIK